MEQGRHIWERIKGLDRAAKIRLILLAVLLGFCVYLSAGFAYEMTRSGSFTAQFVDTSDTHDVYVDGSDFTWAVVLLGHIANAMLLILVLFLMALYAGIIAVATFVPVLLLRLIGLRKNCCVSPDEHVCTRTLYFTAIGLSLVVGLILTRFTAILQLLVFTTVWALLMLIYVIPVKNRVLRGEEPPVPAEQGASTE